MTAADALLDLVTRLEEAATHLDRLAHENRFSPTYRHYYSDKAAGIRLALDYVRELQRMAGADL